MPNRIAPRARVLCFDYSGLFLALGASLCTSLVFDLRDDVLTWAEAMRSFLNSVVAAFAYAQSPYSPLRPQHQRAVAPEVKQ